MELSEIARMGEEAAARVGVALTEAEIRALEVELLGKKGSIKGLNRFIGQAPRELKAATGQAINVAKRGVEAAITRRRQELRDAVIQAELDDRSFDITLPGVAPQTGALHPLTQVQDAVEEVCLAMGFHVLDYPEVEDDFHNFQALNIPPDHPARDAQDTFWLKDGNLLRTHTSPGQIRAIRELGAPLRAVFPGKVFRYEALDASHEHTFHQIEGLMIDRVVSAAHLISAMKTLLGQIFGREVLVRLRPGYFPFVEPGFELDMGCLLCGGSGCRVCKQSGWVEFLGCGLVHPNVLRSAGLSPDDWQGWAFGMGLSRLTMMRYGIDDIRHLMGGDIRFLSQFG